MTNRRPIWGCISLLLLGSAAHGQTSNQHLVQLTVPREPLAQALNTLAEQSDLRIVYYTDSVPGSMAAPINGRLTAEDALKMLLANTDLRYEFVDERTVSITPLTTVSDGEGDGGGGSTPAADSAPSAPAPHADAGAAASPAAPAPGARAAKPSSPVLEEIVVTGSNLPQSAKRSDVPVTVIGAKDIAESGVNSNLLDVLRKRVPEFAGRTNAGGGATATFSQNTSGGSQLSIRNLDTLILLNGRRIASSGANGFSTGRSFVDVSSIPVAAIQRVEVLTDGASAIYGSDAIGGVVNIILKSNYEGVEVGGRYGGATDPGGYNEKSAYAVAGSRIGAGNFTLTASWSESRPLFGNTRPFDSPLYGKTAALPGVIGVNGTNPGGILAPTLGSPSAVNPVGVNATATSVNQLIANGTYLPATTASISNAFDVSRFESLLLGEEQRGLIGDLSMPLVDDRLVLFGDFELSDVKNFDQFLPVADTVTVPAGSPYNPLTTAFPQVTFADLNAPRQVLFDAPGARVMLGLRGKINSDWNWETGFVYDQNEIEQRQKNLLYVPNVARAIAGGYDGQGNAVAGGAYSRVITGFSESSTAYAIQPALDFFSRNPNPAALANLLGTEQLNTRSVLETADAKIVGTPVQLPGGKLGFALGISARREELSSHADENGYNTGPTNHRWFGGVYLDPFHHTRTVDAVYAEVRAPITGPSWNLPGLHALDLSLAGRDERYSDAGNSSVPKFGVRWEPFDDQFVARFTYSRSFTAPTLFAMFGPTSTNLTAASVLKQVFGVSGQVNQLAGNNPNLKPSVGWSRSFGVQIAPHALPGLTVTADFVDIFQKGIPGGAGATNILSSVDKYGPASPFFSQFSFNAYPGQTGATLVTGPGQLSAFLKGGGSPSQMFMEDHFINLGGAHVEATDVNVDYALPTESWGRFEFSTAGAFVNSYLFQALPDQPFYQYAGFATFIAAGNQGTLPKYRLFSTFDWQYQNWNMLVANTYIPSVTDIGGGGATFYSSTTLKPTPVDRYTTWDLQLSYAIDRHSATERPGWLAGCNVTVGVNNLFDRMPPMSPQAFIDANVDTGTYSPIGRLVFASASIDF